MKSLLFSANLYQHPLVALAVKLTVEDLFPGAKAEPAVCDVKTQSLSA
jgi:hypothetical protein